MLLLLYLLFLLLLLLLLSLLLLLLWLGISDDSLSVCCVRELVLRFAAKGERSVCLPAASLSCCCCCCGCCCPSK